MELSYELIPKSVSRKALNRVGRFSNPIVMKNLIALFSKKRSQVSFAAFSTDVLSVNELVNVRGGGEPAAPVELPILIPPDGGKMR